MAGTWTEARAIYVCVCDCVCERMRRNTCLLGVTMFPLNKIAL